jgi:hypothetical protein
MSEFDSTDAYSQACARTTNADRLVNEMFDAIRTGRIHDLALVCSVAIARVRLLDGGEQGRPVTPETRDAPSSSRVGNSQPRPSLRTGGVGPAGRHALEFQREVRQELKARQDLFPPPQKVTVLHDYKQRRNDLELGA